MPKLLPLLAAVALALPAASQTKPDLGKFVYPMAKPLAAPIVVVDASDFPEGKEWGDAAKRLVETWYPTVCSLLATDAFVPPKEIRLVIKKEIGSPAYASGGTITINGKWITDHPNDLGMIIHELTHIIQAYPHNKQNTGWLVEGIADYIRWWRYEPEAPRPRIDPEKSKYTDAYRTTGYFLAWASRKYDMRLIPALDRALRAAGDPMPVFEKVTGKTADALWQEFILTKP